MTEKNEPRRSRDQIIMDILQLLANGENKITHLFFKANISYTVTKSIIILLQKKGYIIKTTILSNHKTRYKYYITAEGTETLNRYKLYRERLTKNGLV